MTMKYPHLAARIFNAPLLIHPGKLDAIIAGLGPRLLGVDALQIQLDASAAAVAPQMFSTRRGTRSDRGYAITDGVAVIGIGGALVHRTRMEADSTRLLGYNDVAADVEDAMANPDVHAIVQVWDSPGGEVAGAFELAARIRDLRGKKPMIAVLDNMGASAAYMGASAADEIMLTTTAYAGSIGVVLRHADFSQALHDDGIKVTHIFAGAHKVDGNPYEPLPESVRAALQADVDGIYAQFVDLVATQRRMDPAAVRATQAQTYRGVAAIAAGLADRLGTTDQVITELAAQRPRIHTTGQTARSTTATDKGASMSGTTQGGQPAATFTQADLDAACERARAEGHTAGLQAGTQAERDRTAAILAHEAATTHVALAHQCIASGLSADQAGAILGAAPQPIQGAAAGSAFAAAMGVMGNPAVSGVERDTSAAADEAALAAQVLQSFGIAARA